MDTIFTLRDEYDNGNIKLNMDDLYEQKKQRDLHTLSMYNRILNRIHTKIKTTSRQHVNTNWCWFIVPEIIIGFPKYDNNACIAYLIDQLKDNGFLIRYTHPNLLLISWDHWTPNYVRDEFKKKTGIVIDGFGNKIKDVPNKKDNNLLIFNNKLNNSNIKTRTPKKVSFKNIDTYKPSGSLVYSKTQLDKITMLNSDNK